MVKMLLEVYNRKTLPKVETERLLLRQRKLEDAEAIFVFAKLAEVSYPAGFPPVKSLADESAYLQDIYPANLEKEGLPSGYGITLKDNDNVIGSVDFNPDELAKTLTHYQKINNTHLTAAETAQLIIQKMTHIKEN
ncbi:TPA: GNAT family N-acetyltransferase [Streptococcus pyogenes]|nr:GNAT family N-acetyltransferase [Streptococcus pyogenes]HES6790925.1 GNAT family N-acetyltransferase [Streptococcus pyogenes]